MRGWGERESTGGTNSPQETISNFTEKESSFPLSFFIVDPGGKKKKRWQLKILMHFSCGCPYLDYHSTQGSCSITDGSFRSQAGWVKV